MVPPKLEPDSNDPRYPNRTLPLVPRVFSDISGLAAGIDLDPLLSGRIGSVSDLDVSAWDVLGDKICYRLADLVKKALADEMILWSRNSGGQTVVGLSISDMSNLWHLSLRVKNSLRRAERLFNHLELERPTIADVARIKNFGPGALLELFGRLESEFGPDLPVDRSSFLRSSEKEQQVHFDQALEKRTLAQSGQPESPKDTRVSLRQLLNLPEIGVRGALEIIGSLESNAQFRMDPNARYPDQQFFLLPQVIRRSPLLSRLNDYLLQPYEIAWESYDQEQRLLVGRNIMDGLQRLNQDPTAVKPLFEIIIVAPISAFERFSLTEESRSIILGGKVIRATGGDPIDVWDYIVGCVGDRQATILKKRWLHRETLELVAQPIGLTRERVRQLEAKSQRTLRDSKTGLKDKGLGERLQWVENQLFRCIEDHGGYAEIGSMELTLGWPENSLKAWFAFNAVVGVLSPRSSHSIGKFGRVWFNRSNVSNVTELSDDSDSGFLRQIGENIVGPMGIMRLEDFLATLDRRHMDQWTRNPDRSKRGQALESAGIVKVLEASYLDELRSGRWVTVGLTNAANEVARAILYGSDPDDDYSDSEGSNIDHLRRGLRSDLIAYWLDGNSNYKSRARVIDNLCKRNTQVFVQTDSTSWGLLGAGAMALVSDEQDQSNLGLVMYAVKEIRKTKSPVTKLDVIDWLSDYCSSRVVRIHIDEALRDGYLIDQRRRYNRNDLHIGLELPLHDRVEGPLNSGPLLLKHGRLSALVLEVLEGEPQGLTENEITRYVRQRRPEASAISIGIYLQYTFNDLVGVTPTGRYRLLSHSGPTGKIVSDSPSTIDTLTRVLSEASEPLPVDEIIARCEQIRRVRYSAIRGYLSQNYGDRFRSDGGGRYSIA